MIHSASSSSSSPAARNIEIAASSTASKSPAQSRPIDQIHIDKASALRSNLQQVPEIRPEVVERAKALAADPSYPSDGIIRQISKAIVNSPDLSEDLS
jgi:hypothetical protein